MYLFSGLSTRLDNIAGTPADRAARLPMKSAPRRL
jgi:hypothetical protein